MKLDKYLKEMCINRNEFCKKLGVSYPTLSNLMKMTNDPHLSIAVRVEDVTGGKVTCRDLVNPVLMKKWEAKAKVMQESKKKSAPTVGTL